ncbi:hypothetical protein [Photorhabdus sp. SF281]|uniref:hypothetical protein n=1 Tax=Photorhabdus sp. SF281 TaxID=3459527 RepID=UPI0040443A79
MFRWVSLSNAGFKSVVKPGRTFAGRWPPWWRHLVIAALLRKWRQAARTFIMMDSKRGVSAIQIKTVSIKVRQSVFCPYCVGKPVSQKRLENFYRQTAGYFSDDICCQKCADVPHYDALSFSLRKFCFRHPKIILAGGGSLIITIKDVSDCVR